MNEERSRQDSGFQEKRARDPELPLPRFGEAAKEAASSPRSDGDGIPVQLVPAEELGSNPQNPYDRLLSQERYARFVALLARIYRSVKEEDGREKGARPAA